MGLLNFINGLFHGDKVEVEYLGKRSNMANDTLIFTGQPDYNSVIGDHIPNDGMDNVGVPVTPQLINQVNSDTAKRGSQMMIPGQRMPRGRGVGVNTQQMPPAAPIAPPQPGYGQQPANYGQLAPGYAPQPQPQPMSYQPQQPPQGMNIPIGQAPQPQPQPMQAPMGMLAEPFSELVITDTECHLFVDLPGIPKENIGIKLTQNNEVAVTFHRDTHVSLMSAEAKPTQKKGGKKKKEATKWAAQVNIPDYLLGDHTVVYSIMKPVDENRISCSFDLGQLHVVLGFRTPLEGKSISIG